MLGKIILLTMMLGLSACVNNTEYLKQYEQYKKNISKFFNSDVKIPSNIDISYDKLENIYFLQNNFDEVYVNSFNPNCGTIVFSPYIGLSKDYGWLRFKFKYSDNKWLFIKNIKFYMDNEKKEYNFPYGFIKQDVYYNNLIEEKFDTTNEFFIKLIKEIPNKGNVSLRLYGEKGTCTYVLNENTKNLILEVKYLYNNLNKTIN